MEKILKTAGIKDGKGEVIHAQNSAYFTLPTHYARFSTGYPFRLAESTQLFGSKSELSSYQQG